MLLRFLGWHLGFEFFKSVFNKGLVLQHFEGENDIESLKEVLHYLSSEHITILNIEDHVTLKKLVKSLKTQPRNTLAQLDMLIFYMRVPEVDILTNSIKRLVRINALNPNIVTAVNFDLKGDYFMSAGVLTQVSNLGRAGKLTLKLSYSDTKIDIEQLRTLFNSENLQGLKQLSLANNNIGDDGVKLLAGSPYLSQLEHLDLLHCGIKNIDSLLCMTSLKSLNLRENSLSFNSFEKLIEHKFDSLLIGDTLEIKHGHDISASSSGIDILYKIPCELIIAAQFAHDKNVRLDENIVKRAVFSIAEQYQIVGTVKDILNQPEKYPFLINSKVDGNTLLHFYANNPAMQIFLFEKGMIPDPEEKGDARLQEIARNPQSVHFKEPIDKIKLFTRGLVTRIGSDNDRIKQAVDSYVSDLSELNALYLSNSIRVGLFSLTKQEIEDITDLPESGLQKSSNKKAFIEFIFSQAKKALNTAYLLKSEGRYVGQATHEEVYDNDSGAKITIPESIGYIKLLIDTFDPSLKARKDLLVDLATENPELIEQKLPEIRSELGNNDISLEQITAPSRFHELLKDIDGDKVDSLFKQISDLDIKEIWREQAKIALLKKVFEASLVGGVNDVSCSQGAWVRIIESLDQIDPEFTKQYSKYSASVWEEVQRSGIDEAKGKEIADNVTDELIKYVRNNVKLIDALEELSMFQINIDNPEEITLPQQKILALVNTWFVKFSQNLDFAHQYLGDNYPALPIKSDYEQIISGFFGNEKIEAFVEKAKAYKKILPQFNELSQTIKDLYENEQITRHKERLKMEVKKLIENIPKQFIDAKSKNRETLLHLAAIIGDRSLVSDLLKKGASFSIKNEKNRTPKDLSRDENVSNLLAKVEEAFSTAYQGKFAKLKDAIEGSGDMPAMARARNHDDSTLLHLAISKKPGILYFIVQKRKDVINLLLENGANIYAENLQKDSPLSIAKRNQEKGIVNQFKLALCKQSSNVRVKRAANLCRIEADGYIEELRRRSTSEQIKFAEEFKAITFEGRVSDVALAEKTRELMLSEGDIRQKSDEISKLLEDPRERRILDLFEDIKPEEISQPGKIKNPKLKQRLINAVGIIGSIRGAHGAFASCSNEVGVDCALNVGGIGYSSLLSQPIENSMVKVMPRIVSSAARALGRAPIVGQNLKFVTQLTGGKFGKSIARRVGGAIGGAFGGAFDIVDIGRSASILSNCAKKKENGEEPCTDKERRDNVASVAFSSVSFVSGVALSAASMPGVGIAVGFGLMVVQGIYSGVSMIIEYKKYGTTHYENLLIFGHTVTFQSMPEDVQHLEARTNIVNQLAKHAWELLKNNPNVAAIAMGLGKVNFETRIIGRKVITSSLVLTRLSNSVVETINDGKGCTQTLTKQLVDGEYKITRCVNITDKAPYTSPDHASIIMNRTNADTADLARVIPQSPSHDAKLICLPKSTPADATHSKNPEAVYPCDNAFVIIDRTNVASANSNQRIVYDLNNINSGEVIGSNRWNNDFVIHGGNPQIFGGTNVTNVFRITDENFSGKIFGGDDANNILDLSNLQYESLQIGSLPGHDGLESVRVTGNNGQTHEFFFKGINRIIGRKSVPESISCTDNETFVNSGGGRKNSEKDRLIDCKKAVIWPYTEVIGAGSNHTFYIKLNKIHNSVGRSEINVKGNGTLVFPDTALLSDCVTYSFSENTLSIEIPLEDGKKFILDVKHYLNKEKTAPNFHLIDKYGNNVLPVIRETDDAEEIKSFRLSAERVFTNHEEDKRWYENISQSCKSYQIFGIVKDKQSEPKYRIFGSTGTDVFDLSEEITFASGGDGSDVYNVGNKKAVTIVDNYAKDQKLDLFQTEKSVLKAYKERNDLHVYCLPDREGKLKCGKTIIKDYFKSPDYQHLMISRGGEMLIPLLASERQVSDSVTLVPFYHASLSENFFFLSERNMEVVIDADEQDVEFYKDKNDLVLMKHDGDIPLTIIARDFYLNQHRWQSTAPYFYNMGKFLRFNLSEKAAQAIDYNEKVKSNYDKTVEEYVYTDALSGELAHNQQRLKNGTLIEVTEDEKRIGVLIIEGINPSQVGVAYSGNDLKLFDKEADHKSLTIKNWHVIDNRISRIEFHLGSSTVVINQLGRFDLNAEDSTEMQRLFNNATLSSQANEMPLDPEAQQEIWRDAVEEQAEEDQQWHDAEDSFANATQEVRQRPHIREKRSITIDREENVASSGSRSRSLINAAFGVIFNTVKSVAQQLAFPPKPALPAANIDLPNAEKKNHNFKNNESRISSSQFCKLFSVEACVNNNMDLLRTLLQTLLDNKCPLPQVRSITRKEARGYALEITKEFEQILNETAFESGISAANLNFNPVPVSRDIIGHLINGKFSEIPKTLYSYAKEACLEFEQTGEFLAQFESQLKRVLSEKGVVELSAKKQKRYKSSKAVSSNKPVGNETVGIYKPDAYICPLGACLQPFCNKAAARKTHLIY